LTENDKVLKANGIKVVALHGKVSPKKRVQLLENFKRCDRDGARVLLMSNVGSVGLNISFAHILIIVVRTPRFESCTVIR
jgi:superfamily II DNA/RNA helicase